MSRAANELKKDYLKNADRISDHERDIIDKKRDIKLRKSWIKDLEATQEDIKQTIILLEGIFNTDVVDNVEKNYYNRWDCPSMRLAAA